MRAILQLIQRELPGSIGLAILVFFGILALFAPLLTPYSPIRSLTTPMQIPSCEHILGTDELGRDLFSRVLYGSRLSLLIGLIASIVTVGLGTLVGLVAGYSGGLIDDVLSRITDLFLSLPSLPFMVVVAAILGPGICKIILVIGLTSWPRTARIIRGQTLEVKEREFVEASRSVGAGAAHLIFKHILPVVGPLVIANVILAVANAIISESGLSFLGLGLRAHVSWGLILHYGFSEGALSSGAWWYIIPPGLCIMLVVLGFTLLGIGLERRFTPYVHLGVGVKDRKVLTQ